jgi:hypothetical protein
MTKQIEFFRYLKGSLKLEPRLLRLEATLGDAGKTPLLRAPLEGLAGRVDDRWITFRSPFSMYRSSESMPEKLKKKWCQI